MSLLEIHQDQLKESKLQIKTTPILKPIHNNIQSTKISSSGTLF